MCFRMLTLTNGLLLYHGGFTQVSEDADSFAIKALLPNRLEDQFCFCNEKAIQSLEFVRSDLYDFKHL